MGEAIRKGEPSASPGETRMGGIVVVQGKKAKVWIFCLCPADVVEKELPLPAIHPDIPPLPFGIARAEIFKEYAREGGCERRKDREAPVSHNH